jgi:2-dehydropantoate 2-reductase
MTGAPDDSRQRLLLMGCGGVGGVIAGGLIRAGYDVTLVTRNPDIARAINESGLRVETPTEQYRVATVASADLKSIQGPFDAIYLMMKATDVEQGAQEACPFLSPTGYVVTFQNGIVEYTIAELVSKERVVGAIVGWGSTMVAPGVYHMTSKGETVIGELDGQITPRLEKLKRTLETGTPTQISTNLRGVLWSKLAINCAITTLGAVTGQTLGAMLNEARVRRLFMTIVSEVVDTATACDVVLEPVGGTLDLHRIYLPVERRRGRLGIAGVSRHLILLAVGARFRRLKSSMLQSFERHRPTEIEFLNGYVVKQAQAKGIPVPINQALADMVRQIEAGTRQIAPANLDELPEYPP